MAPSVLAFSATAETSALEVTRILQNLGEITVEQLESTLAKMNVVRESAGYSQFIASLWATISYLVQLGKVVMLPGKDDVIFIKLTGEC